MVNLKSFLMDKAGLNATEFATLTEGITVSVFKKGDCLSRPGGNCREIFFVEKGLLRLYTLGADSKEQVLHFAPESWLVSDRGSAHFNEPARYFIDAVEKTEAVILNRDFFDRAASTSERFREFNERALHSHVRQLERRISMLLGATAKERYLEFIRLYPNLALRVPQWMAASYMGMTPESMSRVRKSLSKEKPKTQPRAS
jgi:CRP/FNR family transcriptional regulator, anaerobic regulatory protein